MTLNNVAVDLGGMTRGEFIAYARFLKWLYAEGSQRRISFAAFGLACDLLRDDRPWANRQSQCMKEVEAMAKQQGLIIGPGLGPNP